MNCMVVQKDCPLILSEGISIILRKIFLSFLQTKNNEKNITGICGVSYLGKYKIV